jgi:hypothetical protein
MSKFYHTTLYNTMIALPQSQNVSKNKIAHCIVDCVSKEKFVIMYLCWGTLKNFIDSPIGTMGFSEKSLGNFSKTFLYYLRNQKKPFQCLFNVDNMQNYVLAAVPCSSETECLILQLIALPNWNGNFKLIN